MIDAAKETAMKTLDQQMAIYAAYHRNGWNKLTHFIGVPLIVFALLIPMAWLRFAISGWEISGALVLVLVVLAWYFALDFVLAVTMVVAIAPLLYFADRIAQMPLATGLWVFGTTFVLGWIFQLVGHAIEGKRPALVDNLLQIFVAPMFLVAEAFFALGLKRDVQQKIEERLKTTAGAA
jgi:uncharacterized membrane protein YGL010W